jgi:hypothetical protein
MKQAARLDGVMSQKMELFISTSVETSSPTKMKYFVVKNTLEGV